MRLGMFVTATFRGQKKETHTEVPATAIMHLHDRDWVFVPTPDKKFRRVEVVSGEICRTRCKRLCPGCNQASRSCRTRVVLQNTVDIQ